MFKSLIFNIQKPLLRIRFQIGFLCDPNGEYNGIERGILWDPNGNPMGSKWDHYVIKMGRIMGSKWGEVCVPKWGSDVFQMKRIM